MDLTNVEYWRGRYRDVGPGASTEAEWLDPMLPFLRRYEGQRFLELGCIPGHASAGILRRVALRPEGVDFADAGHLYLESLRGHDPVFHRADVRTFVPAQAFDVVGSFGLVEHFDDPGEMLRHHDRLLRAGGLCVVEVPNFRFVQYAYHRIFDAPDLARHNLAAMEPALFRDFAKERGHDVLFLGYAGRLRFWGLHDGAGRLMRVTSTAVCRAASLVGRVLPAELAWTAPWLVYVGRKR